jgi:hypothetical protein
MQIRSSAFKEGEMIPEKYTCDARKAHPHSDRDVSPPLEWSDAPGSAKFFALISDDPDAPRGTWVHWVLYDLPATARSLPENVPQQKELAGGGKQGINDSMDIGYGGPCPPSGIHRYYFKLYALDAATNLKPGATKAQLLEAMKGHILAESQLMGKYKRKR